MFEELTNLISTRNRRMFRQEYFVRLATVTAWLLTFVVIAECVLLLPSYLFESQAVSSHTVELQQLSQKAATSQEQQVQSEVQALSGEASYLQGLSTTPTASMALRAILAVPRPGITLSGFTYGSAQSATNSALKTMQITGIADTREDLRGYDAALSALPYVSSADLPISEYAKASSIPFTITLTGSLTP
jgi:hypothetical protein